MKRSLLLSVCLFLALCAFAEDKYSDVTITVVKQETGKPVRNASVIVHSVDPNGKQSNDGANLKTDNEGKTSYDGLPYGKVRIQVIAKGLQTFGNDFELNQDKQEIVIKMKPPQEQYSIYNEKKPAPNK